MSDRTYAQRLQDDEDARLAFHGLTVDERCEQERQDFYARYHDFSVCPPSSPPGGTRQPAVTEGDGCRKLQSVATNAPRSVVADGGVCRRSIRVAHTPETSLAGPGGDRVFRCDAGLSDPELSDRRSR